MTEQNLQAADAAERTVAWVDDLIDRFASLSETHGSDGVTRLGYTPLERRAHQVFATFMSDLGLSVHSDTAGNTIAELAGDGRCDGIGTGSHLDSVPHGGRFDGIVGVVAAMLCAQTLTSSGYQPRHPLRFVVFANEEGARFGQACNGSRLAAGTTDAEALGELRDRDGISVLEAMHSVGLDPERLNDARWRREDWDSFVEVHIEQGSVLADGADDIGIVDTISGSTRLRLTVHGVASHSGGTPMLARHDALVSASAIVLAANALARDPEHFGTRITIGRIVASPNSMTTIPGEVTLDVDIRDVDTDRQRQTALALIAKAKELALLHETSLDAHLIADTAPTLLSHRLVELASHETDRLGMVHRVLPSGASHDTQQISHVCETGMLFVPSRHGGVSHSPDEFSRTDDIARGVQVLTGLVKALDLTDRQPRS
ncbi:Zn-dependent hydrolase [Pseudoclavibacter sp. CFCC 11306]|uniref:Zn-dependent hydrolase n=1 Tax=Pseudoclavibacter sp. CFCC 11306 TaxID=1564493 RepID=UPI00130142D7|nr:Zn-dependent hydrolase [Pseudoclavibacter sp. CFCC 11306]KAB1657674.1 Zn-dependent hydrolase [Pseudoclavibacter sp. CFCC 11306]